MPRSLYIEINKDYRKLPDIKIGDNINIKFYYGNKGQEITGAYISDKEIYLGSIVNELSYIVGELLRNDKILTTVINDMNDNKICALITLNDDLPIEFFTQYFKIHGDLLPSNKKLDRYSYNDDDVYLTKECIEMLDKVEKKLVIYYSLKNDIKNLENEINEITSKWSKKMFYISRPDVKIEEDRKIEEKLKEEKINEEICNRQIREYEKFSLKSQNVLVSYKIGSSDSSSIEEDSSSSLIEELVSTFNVYVYIFEDSGQMYEIDNNDIFSPDTFDPLTFEWKGDYSVFLYTCGKPGYNIIYNVKKQI